jgi:uncharacterized membrane protein YbhN (UPF0104 family)
MKKYFWILAYASIGCLIYYLYRFDYIDLRGMRPSYPHLVLSVILLCLAFLFDALGWWKTLSIHDIKVSASKGIASQGLSTVAKYIPGKVWVILGRAAYITQEGLPLVKSSLMSIKAQIIASWVGLLLGLVPALILQRFTKLNMLSIVIIVLATVLVLSSRTHSVASSLLSSLTKKRIEIPVISLRQLWRISVYYGISWLLFSFGYFFLVLSFHPGVPIIVAFAFPLAVTLGVLAIVFPGGLGVREGVMTGYLVLMGISAKEAATISLLARLWFIAGEVFIFCTAFILDKRMRRGG